MHSSILTIADWNHSEFPPSSFSSNIDSAKLQNKVFFRRRRLPGSAEWKGFLNDELNTYKLTRHNIELFEIFTLQPENKTRSNPLKVCEELFRIPMLGEGLAFICCSKSGQAFNYPQQREN